MSNRRLVVAVVISFILGMVAHEAGARSLFAAPQPAMQTTQRAHMLIYTGSWNYRDLGSATAQLDNAAQSGWHVVGAVGAFVILEK